MSSAADLPESVCPLGYPRHQVEEIFNHDAGFIAAFDKFMEGQTGAYCDGRRWSNEAKEYEIGCDRPHGMVVYGHDLKKFLRGGGGTWD